MPELRLQIVAPDGSARLVVIHGSGAVLGREQPADIVIAERAMSRRHARIVFSGGAWLIEDLNSRNGTLVNSSRVSLAELKAGDVICLGKTTMHVISGAAADAGCQLPSIAQATLPAGGPADGGPRSTAEVDSRGGIAALARGEAPEEQGSATVSRRPRLRQALVVAFLAGAALVASSVAYSVLRSDHAAKPYREEMKEPFAVEDAEKALRMCLDSWVLGRAFDKRILLNGREVLFLDLDFGLSHVLAKYEVVAKERHPDGWNIATLLYLPTRGGFMKQVSARYLVIGKEGVSIMRMP